MQALYKRNGLEQNRKMNNKKISNLKKAFGSLKLKKSTQKVMDEIDEGYEKYKINKQ